MIEFTFRHSQGRWFEKADFQVHFWAVELIQLQTPTLDHENTPTWWGFFGCMVKASLSHWTWNKSYPQLPILYHNSSTRPTLVYASLKSYTALCISSCHLVPHKICIVWSGTSHLASHSEVCYLEFEQKRWTHIFLYDQCSRNNAGDRGIGFQTAVKLFPTIWVHLNSWTDGVDYTKIGHNLQFIQECKLARLIDQCARSVRAGSCRGSELNSTRALILRCNSTAVSSVVHTCISYKLFACKSELTFI